MVYTVICGHVLSHLWERKGDWCFRDPSGCFAFFASSRRLPPPETSLLACAYLLDIVVDDSYLSVNLEQLFLEHLLILLVREWRHGTPLGSKIFGSEVAPRQGTADSLAAGTKQGPHNKSRDNVSWPSCSQSEGHLEGMMWQNILRRRPPIAPANPPAMPLALILSKAVMFS